MNRGRIVSLALGAIFCAGFVVTGCSSDSSSPTDAGKKDTGSGTGGKGGSAGSGGSSAVGGSGGRGGSGGNAGGSGGSSATGGSAGSIGGAGGSAGATAGATAGGSTGTGGSTGGAGGTTGPIDGGPRDADSSDAIDAPLPGNDAADSGETGSSADGGVPVLLDSGSLDGVSLDAVSLDTQAIDSTPVRLDADEDAMLDTAALDVGSSYDGANNPIPCSSVVMASLGTTIPSFNTTGSYCLATCDTIDGWSVSNFDGRTLLLVDGQSVAVPANGAAGTLPLPTPKYLGTYTVFQVNGGDLSYARLYWWGTAHACEAPDGGFGL